MIENPNETIAFLQKLRNVAGSDQVESIHIDHKTCEHTLTFIPGGDNSSDACDARAAALAPRMAVEGWRFCPCFPTKRTHQHARIFGLVHTNLANRLAHDIAQEALFSSEKQSVA